MLQIENITKKFGGITALSEVRFQVEANQLLSLIGPNGSGKTTLFNVITGIYRANKGRVLYQGESIHTLTANRIAKRGVSRTFQNIKLFHTLTVLENVLVASYCQGTPGSWSHVIGLKRGKVKDKTCRDRSREILQFVGLGKKENEIASNLPYGEQKKLEIARALASDPKLLLLDEPMGGLNSSERKEAVELILTINGEGVTVMLIEHDMRMVMSISSRIVVLNFGKVIAQGLPEEIRRNKLVIEAYLGPELN